MDQAHTINSYYTEQDEINSKQIFIHSLFGFNPAQYNNC